MRHNIKCEYCKRYAKKEETFSARNNPVRGWFDAHRRGFGCRMWPEKEEIEKIVQKPTLVVAPHSKHVKIVAQPRIERRAEAGREIGTELARLQLQYA